MKIKFLILALVLSLTVCALCACGENEPAPTETPTSPTATEPNAEPTDKGIFVTDPIDPLMTLPEDLQGITLPVDEFDEEFLQQFEDDPITNPVDADPSETEATPTEPNPTTFNPDILPEHVFEEE